MKSVYDEPGLREYMTDEARVFLELAYSDYNKAIKDFGVWHGDMQTYANLPKSEQKKLVAEWANSLV